MISVLHILPGPVFGVEERFGQKFKKLSEFSQGKLVSMSTNESSIQMSAYQSHIKGVGPKFGMWANILFVIACFKAASQLKRTKGLDLIVCYDPLKTGIIGYLLKIIYNCKLAIEVNGVYESPELYKDINGKTKQIKSRLYPFIQKRVLNKADGIKCLYTGQLGGVELCSKIPVDYFFDYTHIDTVPYQDKDSKLILNVGFPMYIKGADVLIKSFKLLFKKYPDWKLMIVGHYIESDIREMESLAEGCDNISMVPPVEFSKIPGLLDACDIFALPSRSEGISRVLLEAMARSKARVATDVGGSHVGVHDEVDGLLCDSNSIEDLSIKLESLMVSEDLRRTYAEAGYLRFQKEFTIDVYGSRIEAFYSKIFNE